MRILFLTAILFGSILSGLSQNKDSTRLKVLVDCRGCDNTYIRQNVTSVDHVRDLGLADVYILVNRTWSASSVIYQFEITGKKAFEGIDNAFQFDLSNVLTSNERRDELVRIVGAALSPYLLHTSSRDDIKIEFPENQLSAPELPENDPWRYWVFEVRGSYELDGQDLRQADELSFGFEGDKVTDDWRVRADYFYFQQLLTVNEDSTVFRSKIQEMFAGASVVRSLGDHWAYGLFGNYNENTVENIRNRYQIGPAIEYSLFPYSEVLTREVTLGYRVGYFRQNYLETTIYDKDVENIITQNISLNVRYRKPWGTISSRVNFNSFINDPERVRLSLRNFFSIRIFQGFNVRFDLNYSVIRDQINLARGNASLEDVILQQRAIATGYELELGMGVSYTFGSIYNNILNPRL